jgi:hypothetical protein
MRLSVNADLVINSTPPPPLRQNGHNCGFAVEMARRGNRGKVLTPTFPPFPPRLEIPQRRGITTFPQRRRLLAANHPKKANLLKLRVCSLSGGEPFSVVREKLSRRVKIFISD